MAKLWPRVLVTLLISLYSSRAQTGTSNGDSTLCANGTEPGGVCFCRCGCDWVFSSKSQQFETAACRNMCSSNCDNFPTSGNCSSFSSCKEIQQQREDNFALQLANDRHSYCFPSTARVELADGGKVSMEDLKVGDLVQVGSGRHSRIFAWGHRIPVGEFDFMEIITEGQERPIRITANHLLYSHGRLISAGSVRVGHSIERKDGTQVPVTRVGTVRAQGLYNPHTTHGDLVVDDIRTSSYTRAMPARAAHSLLAPFRMLYRSGLFAEPLGSLLYDSTPSWFRTLTFFD